jgi:hypothetical protein
MVLARGEKLYMFFFYKKIKTISEVTKKKRGNDIGIRLTSKTCHSFGEEVFITFVIKI